jgi:ABC-2 type transport system ATP-binding protein
MIEVKNLEMFYGRTHALKGISFSVAKGEVVGLLGPNGAGKTTTMNILATHIVPTSGTAAVCGYDIHENPLEVRRVVGYLPETAPLYADMEVGEYLTFVGRGRGLRGAKLRQRRDWVIESCKIREIYRSLVLELSRGFRQRVGIAQALIHDPEVLILDEPTAGLDPLQILEIRKLTRELAKEKTVIFSTHIMQEASAISDRIVIIDEGRITAEGTISQLQEKVAQNPRIVLTVAAPRSEVEESLKSVAGEVQFEFVSQEGELSTFEVRATSGADTWYELARLIKEKGWLVRRFAEEKPSLEETFVALTMRSQR